MIYITILILFSVSLNCQTTDPTDWCPLIQTNGASKELGIYHRFLNAESKAEFVMFNRDGEEWLFNITYDKTTDKYDIKLLYNTIKYKVEAFVYRFGIFRYDPKWMHPGNPTQYQDCYVRRKVNII